MTSLHFSSSLLTLAVILNLAACSEDETPAAEPERVLLGLFTRADAGFTDDANVSLVLMALREINDAGGLRLGGRDLLLDLETVGFEDPSASTARKAFDSLAAAGVHGVLGPPWSSQLLGSVEEQDGAWRRAVFHEIVVISESASNSAITHLDDDNFVFRTAPPSDAQARIGAEHLYQEGYRTAAILARDDSYAAGLGASFRAAFEQLGGEVLQTTVYPIEQNLEHYEFNRELDATFEVEPEVIYLIAFDELTQLSLRISQRGDIYKLPSRDVAFFGADSLYDLAILDGCTVDVLSRLSGTSQGPDENSTDFLELSAAIEAEGLGAPWNSAAQLYDATYLLALAMQAADSSDPTVYRAHVSQVSKDDPGDTVVYVNDFARARKALLAGQGVNYEGASGPLEIDANGDPRAGVHLLWRVELQSDDSPRLVQETVIPY